MVLESILILFFTHSCPVFPTPFTEETIFSPLYILASFGKVKVPVDVWVHLWLPVLFHWSVSVFMPVPYCLDDLLPPLKIAYWDHLGLPGAVILTLWWLLTKISPIA